MIFQCGGYARGVCKVFHHVREYKLEKAVIESLKEILTLGTINFTVRRTEVDSRSHIGLIQAQMKQVKLKLDRAKNSYIAGIDTIEEYKATKTSLMEEFSRLEKQSEQIKPSSDNAKKKMLENIHNVYSIITSEECSVTQKNSAIKSIIEKVIYSKEDKHVDIFYYLDATDLIK